MRRNFRIGTRKSPLALKQVDEIVHSLKRFCPDSDIGIDIVTIDTYGDIDKNTAISDIEGSDFFTREIDEALLKNEIDLAVHSAKDLPDVLLDGLMVICVTDSISCYDCLVSCTGLKLKELPYGAAIGTSSLRRKTQLKQFRNDFNILDIRGDIENRLEKLDNGMYDAIVLAHAGLIRLGLENRITETIPFDILKPHPLQGALAVVLRKEDYEGAKSLFSWVRPWQA